MEYKLLQYAYYKREREAAEAELNRLAQEGWRVRESSVIGPDVDHCFYYSFLLERHDNQGAPLQRYLSPEERIAQGIEAVAQGMHDELEAELQALVRR